MTPLTISLLTSVALVKSSLVVRIGGFGQWRYRQQFLLADIDRALDGKVPWGRGGLVNGVEIQLGTGERVGLKVSYFLGSKRRRQWIDAINARSGPPAQAAADSLGPDPDNPAPVPGAAFWLQHRSVRRRAISVLIAGQTIAYAASAGLALRGGMVLTDGDVAGLALLLGGIAGLAASVLVFASLAQVLVQPKIRIDPTAATIEVVRFPIRTVVAFDDAENMSLRAGIGGLRLEGPMTDATGIQKPHLNVFLGLTGLVRDDGTRHPLAALMPTPLGGLNDDVLLVDRMEWIDASRLARFRDLRRFWDGTASDRPDPIAR